MYNWNECILVKFEGPHCTFTCTSFYGLQKKPDARACRIAAKRSLLLLLRSHVFLMVTDRHFLIWLDSFHSSYNIRMIAASAVRCIQKVYLHKEIQKTSACCWERRRNIIYRQTSSQKSRHIQMDRQTGRLSDSF